MASSPELRYDWHEHTLTGRDERLIAQAEQGYWDMTEEEHMELKVAQAKEAVNAAIQRLHKILPTLPHLPHLVRFVQPAEVDIPFPREPKNDLIEIDLVEHLEYMDYLEAAQGRRVAAMRLKSTQKQLRRFLEGPTKGKRAGPRK